MNKTLQQTLASTINTYLALDPESTHRLKKLAGKTASITLKPFNYDIHLSFTPDGVTLSQHQTPSDVHITGTPLAMLGLMLDPDNRQSFFAEDIIMTGDAEVGMEVVELFDALHIEWEEPLSQLIGDIPTHHLSRTMSHCRQWLHTTAKSFQQNTTDYLQEEKAFLPTREALHDLFNDIDQLRMDVDRIAARAKQFEV